MLWKSLPCVVHETIGMLRAVDNYFLNKEEPVRGCLLALRAIILNSPAALTEEWKYGMPFYCRNGKMFCYLWTHKKFGQPYIGFVEGQKIDNPLLLQEKRSRMKILLIDPDQDIPLALINDLIAGLLKFYP